MSDHDPTGTHEDDPRPEDASGSTGRAQPVAEEHDQDSEPTMNAPEEGRPDGLSTGDAGSGGSDEGTSTTGGDGSPS